MKINLIFKIILFTITLLPLSYTQAQKTKKSYLDIIDYWKKESFNKNVKEITTEHTVYENNSGRFEKKIRTKSYTKSNKLFNKFGFIVSQIDQIKSYPFLGSKNQKTFTRINYEYDTKNKLLKEKIYINLDTLTFKPIDTSNYSIKIYNYENNKPLKECLEFNTLKVLIKKTVLTYDTIKRTLEIVVNNLENNNKYQFKTIHEFDTNSVLIQQTYFQFGKMSGINVITYDEKGRKIRATLSSATSYYESSESFKYDNQDFIIEERKGSNLDPGEKKYFNYTFDKNKNWLTKEIKTEDGNVVEYFKRKITYFK